MHFFIILYILMIFNIFKILLIAKIEIEKEKLSLNLALIQWYDFKSQSQPYYHGCPRLQIKELYNFIEIEAIQDIIHIIPRFKSKNEYFLNNYIF